MIKFIRQIGIYAFLILAFSGVPTAQAQDRVTVDRAIKFQRGRISAPIGNRIQRGTSHVDRVRAREGQQMAVVLKPATEPHRSPFLPATRKF